MFKLYEVSNGKVKFANKAYLHIDNIFDVILNDEEGIIELNLENQSLNLNIIPKIYVNQNLWYSEAQTGLSDRLVIRNFIDY